MKKTSFRHHHLLALLDAFEEQALPLDLSISHYFRAHKALGSKDRAEIAETVYGMVRWKGLLDYLSDKPATWEKRLELFLSGLEKFQTDPAIPPHVRLSFPKLLYDLIVRSYGEARASELCPISNLPAPTTVRINPLKTTRDEMLKRWQPLYQISPCLHSEYGIVFHKKIHFFSLPEFQEGLFEIQDEASQLVSALVDAEPGQQVMDYCAGSGGKTLAFAHKMGGKGQIHLHDVRPRILSEAHRRLRRAGIQNAQTVLADDPKLKKLKKRMDWVLVDAPCTGTGTMRRNPDMKWNFSEEGLERLVSQQRVIFEKGLSFLKPGGRIVYATCSILREENQEQLSHFTKTYGLAIVGEPFQSLPADGGMDGFYGVVLQKQ